MSEEPLTQAETPPPSPAPFTPAPVPTHRRSNTGLWLAVILIAFIGGIGATLWGTGALQNWWNGGSAAPLAATGPAVPAASPAMTGTVTQANVSALDAKVATLSARLDNLSTQAMLAGDKAGKAEAMLIAFAARRALDNGAPLGYLETELRARFGEAQPKAVATIITAADEPVTLIDLQGAFDELTPALMGRRDEGDWWTATKRELANLVIIRKATSPSPLPEKALQRARSLLAAARVEAAIAEVEGLPGRANADSWLQMARRYNEARRALDVIESAAILAGRATPPPPVVPTQPAVAPSQPSMTPEATPAPAAAP
ncbi:hypothetical protein [Sphingobium subterraneum]|uniref:Outer membrane murein-binding lipoprotein Lpp n=1 Tax=Sphingobium subterraneum TaxID=627688 RepID=A0A841IZM5_9SPHN|nr:hypothetical protein [Sphingobium subterraneum]MBB6124113.1 outer membrane murein-binding lipoprotein Lpp [Sphingobium subterraneum]